MSELEWKKVDFFGNTLKVRLLGRLTETTDLYLVDADYPQADIADTAVDFLWEQDAEINTRWNTWHTTVYMYSDEAEAWIIKVVHEAEG